MYKWWYCIGFMLERSTNLSMLVKDYFLFFPRDGDLALCRRSVNLSTHIQTALTMGTVLAKNKKHTLSTTVQRALENDCVTWFRRYTHGETAHWRVEMSTLTGRVLVPCWDVWTRSHGDDMYRTAKSGSVWFVSLWIHFLSFFSPFFLISLKHREFPWQKNRFYARSCLRLGL